jgi:hypothetical protein
MLSIGIDALARCVALNSQQDHKRCQILSTIQAICTSESSCIAAVANASLRHLATCRPSDVVILRYDKVV